MNSSYFEYLLKNWCKVLKKKKNTLNYGSMYQKNKKFMLQNPIKDLENDTYQMQSSW